MARKNKVFADSNYFIALQNINDSLHEQALIDTQKLYEDNAQIVISNFVFLEVVTIISQQSGRKDANRLGDYVIENPEIEIIQIDFKLQKESWKIFKSIAKKNMGLIDCSNVAVIQNNSISQLLTYDKTDFSSLRNKYNFSFYS